jgi:iron complex outermembrane receptor protein
MTGGLRYGLVSAAVLASLAGVSHAAEDTTDIDEVTVTGSRIRGVAPVGSPVISLGREELDLSSASTVADFLKEIPQVVGTGIDETRFVSTGINASNASRATAINLRGLSPAATLVLLDGHRVTPSGTAGAFVDSSAIPSSAIERLEVVADGSSALYGSDAIAGVVNLIIRKNFEGAETTLRDNFADGYSRFQASQLLGHRWSSGNVMLAYEFSTNDALNSSERDFYRADQRPRGGSDFRSQNCNPGTLRIGTTNYAIPTAASGVSPPASGLVAGTRNLCDNSYTDIIPDQHRHSAVLFASQELTERASVSFEGYWSLKKLEASFAAQGSATTSTALNVPATNAYFVRPTGTTAATQVDYSFFSQVGALSAKGESETYSGILETQIKLGSDWRMAAALSWGQNWDYTFSRAINTAALNAALASNNRATALNPYGLGTPQSVLDNIFTGQFAPAGRNTMTGGEARADGSLFEMAGGTVRMAVGAEYRRYALTPVTTRGTVTAPLVTIDPPDPRKVASGYAELYLPLVGSSNQRTGVQRLEVSLAGRIDDYSDFGTTTNPKIGVTWAPAGNLTVKGSYGTSFRAPALSDLKAPGAAATATTENDPRSTTGQSRGITVRAGNPDLGPEKARTWMLGIDVHPASLPGLKAELTYFDINYKNQIAAIFGGALQQETLYADVITRNPTQAQVNAVLASYALSGVLPVPVQYIIDARPQNRGKTVAAGLDFQSSYRWEPASFGQLRAGLTGTYYTKYDTQQTPTAPLLDRINFIGNPLKYRVRASLGWSRASFDANLALTHQSDYTDNTVTPIRDVASYTTVDLSLGYGFDDDAPGSWLRGVRVNLNATNLLDKDPPFVNSTAGFDPAQASPYGRLIAASITKRW